MASSRLTLGIVFLLAGGLCLAAAYGLPRQPRLIKDCEQAGLTYGHFAEVSVLEEGTAPAGLIAATVGTALLAREALKRKPVGR